MTIKKFEEIDAWKKARQLTNKIYSLTSKKPFNSDYGLRDQIQRASISIMANIAEGFDSNSDEDFIRFLKYAIRSSTEVQSHLYVAKDQKYIKEKDFDEAYNKLIATKNLISGLIRYLKS